MDCPRCNVDMKEVTVAEIRVDLCPQCEGSWYDGGELGEIFGVSEEELTRSGLSPTLVGDHPEVDLRERLKCPRCSGWMRRYNYLHDSQVEVDGCTCGLWLDDGELSKVIDYVAQSGVALDLLAPEKQSLLQRIMGLIFFRVKSK